MQKNAQPPRRRRGVSLGLVLTVIAVLVAAAASWWLLRPSGGGGSAVAEADMFEARRGDFEITVPASGELAARRQIEIKNELETSAVITEIVDEGVRVSAGTVLVRFNDEELLNKIKDAEETRDVALNNLETAEADLDIKLKKRESEMAAADLRIRLAELALRSWQEGEFVTTTQDHELKVKTAEKEYERALARFEAAQRLMEQEFISVDDYKLDEIALLKAESGLMTAKLQQRVYIEYDSVRQREEKESDLQQAKDERDRTKESLDAEIASAESNVRTRRNQLERAEERLQKWRDQLELCIIRAPSEGLVVYASSLQSGRWRRNDDDPPQVGTQVPRSKTIMVLPDVSQMIASVKVNEALSGLIEPGEPATVFADALPDTPIDGAVHKVSVLAETGGWRDPNRRDYTVEILLGDAAELGLKPSMSCKSEIAVGRVSDAVHVPVQSIFREGPVTFVYTRAPGGYAQSRVSVGRSSELFVEVVEGLEAGQMVLLREPGAGEVVARIDESGDAEQGPPRVAGADDRERSASRDEDRSGDRTAAAAAGRVARRGG